MNEKKMQKEKQLKAVRLRYEWIVSSHGSDDDFQEQIEYYEKRIEELSRELSEME